MSKSHSHSHGKQKGEEAEKEPKEVKGPKEDRVKEKASGFSYATTIGISLAVMVAAFAITISLLPSVVRFLELEGEFYKPEAGQALVRRLEAEISRARWNPEEHAARGELKMLWQTPIMNVNIAALIGSADVKKFTERLAAAIIQEHKKIPAATAIKGHKSRNQQFYEAQKEAGWKTLQGPERKLLEEFFNMAVEKMLRGIGMPEREISNRSKAVEIWGSIQEVGMTEVAKCFPDSMVTGIFFVKIKELSQSLLFDDPRGPLPPFDNKLNTKPFIGDLFIFPSWLFHQISTPKEGEELITVMFNVPGRWASTVGISEEFALEEHA